MYKETFPSLIIFIKNVLSYYDLLYFWSFKKKMLASKKQPYPSWLGSSDSVVKS